MKVIIIYDINAFREDLQSDWWFSVLVEAKNTPKILFDTWTDWKNLLSNMEKLNIDPITIDKVFISHAHFDHTWEHKFYLRRFRKYHKGENWDAYYERGYAVRKTARGQGALQPVCSSLRYRRWQEGYLSGSGKPGRNSLHVGLWTYYHPARGSSGEETTVSFSPRLNRILHRHSRM